MTAEPVRVAGVTAQSCDVAGREAKAEMLRNGGRAKLGSKFLPLTDSGCFRITCQHTYRVVKWLKVEMIFLDL